MFEIIQNDSNAIVIQRRNLHNGMINTEKE